jgi:hypothetical protein
MMVLNYLNEKISALDKKDFYKYLLILIGVILLFIALLMFQYFRVTSRIKKQIRNINSLREDVRVVLSKYEQIQKQRKAVDAILSEEEDFNIVGYFNDVVNQLNLSGNKKEERSSQVDREDNYRESVINVTFVDMNMKQLCELLNVIENKARIFTKELEITKSKKSPTIEVNLTIATLSPKTAVPE